VLWSALSRPIAAAITALSLSIGGLASIGGGPATPYDLNPARPASSTTASAAVSPADSVVDAYRGLGSWVDIYERTSWADPERAIAGMHDHGVRTLYVETSNYRRKLPIKFAAKQARFIQAAHRAGMQVVAWYLPGFRDIRKDYWRSMKAIRFRTQSGQRFDSFALDIESPEVANPYVRTRRLVELSERIRRAVGPSYPLGAIIPTPLGMKDNPTYWPGFPYGALAKLYDVFVPMTYFTWRVSGMDEAHAYTTACIQIIRHEVGSRSVPIHVIGGISDESTSGEADGFVHAVREEGVIGGSYYAYHGTVTNGLWPELRRIPRNPVERPALPVRVGYATGLGNVLGGDRTHPHEVVFQTGPIRGSRTLVYQAYDAQRGEVAVRLNWHRVGTVPAGVAGAWSAPARLRLPGRLFSRHGKNYLSFTPTRGGAWGVRTVRLTG
jgi:hypothetical protein